MHPNWLLIIRVPIIWCYVPLAWWVWTRNYVSACVFGEIYHVMPLLGARVGSFTWSWWSFHHMWWMVWSRREKIKYVLWWCPLNIFFLIFFAPSRLSRWTSLSAKDYHLLKCLFNMHILLYRTCAELRDTTGPCVSFSLGFHSHTMRTRVRFHVSNLEIELQRNSNCIIFIGMK